MHRKILFTLASILALASLHATAEEMVAAQPADTELVPAQQAETGLLPARPAEPPHPAAAAPAAAQDNMQPPAPMAGADQSAAAAEHHLHNPARDAQTDYRYCLDLKTNAEIAACRYKKK